MVRVDAMLDEMEVSDDDEVMPFLAVEFKGLLSVDIVS